MNEVNINDFEGMSTEEIFGEGSAVEETQNDVEVPAEEHAPSQEPEQKPEPEPEPVLENKQNKAFAEMRTQNKQYQKTLAMLAQTLGIDPKNPNLNEEIQNRTFAAIAKANNMDPQILQRLDKLEGIEREYNQMKAEKLAMQQCNAIQEKFGASSEDVVGFIEELQSEGFDLLDSNLNLEREFISRNFDRIVEMRVNAAVNAEQTRAAKGGSASHPSNTKGQTIDNNNDAPLTQSDYDKWLNSLEA